jgi:hypothetical protein
MSAESGESRLDWRLAFVATLDKDLPAAYPGGPAHSAGTELCVAAAIPHPAHGITNVPLPSFTALALSVSIDSARQAVLQRERLRYQSTLTPDGRQYSLLGEDTSAFFAFLERALVTVTFAMQAIECYCNDVIGEKLKESIVVKWRKVETTLTALEAERQLSTEEKLCILLPCLLDLPSPKTRAVWSRFKTLKQLRDDAVHMKSYHQTGVRKNSERMRPRKTIVSDLLSRDLHGVPGISIEMIKHFSPSPTRWLVAAERRWRQAKQGLDPANG